MVRIIATVTRPIVFLSDFGYRNESVGICHAVANRIAPECRIVDLSHGVAPLDVAAGALLLADSLPYLHPEAVVLAVVDPSVGRKHDVAIEATDGRLLVGPDNGLLAPAWRASGGIAAAVSITAPGIILDPVSPSFHARDVLTPAAAHLAAGASLSDLGPSCELGSLAEIHVPEPSIEPGKIACEVLELNRFGNIQLNVRSTHLAEAVLEQGDDLIVEALNGGASVKRISTYADLDEGQWGIMVDPRGWLSIVRRNQNAAEGLGGISSGDVVWLTHARA